MSSYEEIFRRYQEKYKSVIPIHISKLEQLIEEMRQGIEREKLASLRIEVHNLRNAGTYGYTQISAVCEKFEIDIIQKIDLLKTARADPKWLETFESHLENIKVGFSHDTGKE